MTNKEIDRVVCKIKARKFEEALLDLDACIPKADDLTVRGAMRYDAAVCYANLGRMDEALASLAEAYKLNSETLAESQRDPEFHALRQDPRFEQTRAFALSNRAFDKHKVLVRRSTLELGNPIQSAFVVADLRVFVSGAVVSVGRTELWRVHTSQVRNVDVGPKEHGPDIGPQVRRVAIQSLSAALACVAAFLVVLGVLDQAQRGRMWTISAFLYLWGIAAAALLGLNLFRVSWTWKSACPIQFVVSDSAKDVRTHEVFARKRELDSVMDSLRKWDVPTQLVEPSRREDI